MLHIKYTLGISQYTTDLDQLGIQESTLGKFGINKSLIALLD